MTPTINSMGSRHFGELLLRPSTFRVPISQISRAAWRTPASQRSLNTSGPAQADRPYYSAETSQKERQTPPPGQEPSPAPRQTNSQNVLSGAIDDLFSGVTGMQPVSRQPARRPANAAARTFGANFSQPGRTSYGRQKLNFDDMADVPVDPSSAPPSTTTASTALQEQAPEHYPRLNASYGRTVDLDPAKGRDIVRGIFMLGGLVSRNKVRSDMAKQKFHERAGLKRKRLKSERWRARFRQEFDATVRRVSELTRKGW
jgi:small subunit ribosomal protein MRP21